MIMLTTCWAMQAQKNVFLNINHNLGTETFDFETVGENDLGDRYKVDRLEYYISQISLTHDGGQITAVEDYWILVNADNQSTFDLGSFDLTDVESISFHIGVEESVNHNDPTLWPSDHPLAPKSPSMHWGWAGGYRFIAMEGNAGTSFNSNFELHCLGDNNYFETTVDLTGENSDDAINLYINADYNEGLKGLGIASGVISHGTLESEECIKNFRDYVFSAGTSTGLFDVNNSLEFSIAPNPSNNGLVNISLDDQGETHHIQLYDLSGKVILETKTMSATTQIQIADKGIYLLSIMDENGNQATKRVIVQ